MNSTHGIVVSVMADVYYCPPCYMLKFYDYDVGLDWHKEKPHPYDEHIPTCSECKRPQSATLRADEHFTHRKY